MTDRFDRFTGGARLALQQAEEEARKLHAAEIGTEHLLLGVSVVGGAGAAALADTPPAGFGLTQERIRRAVEFIAGRNMPPAGAPADYHPLRSPRGRKAIELAVDEARRMGPYIGTDHLLLGLVREGDGVAAGILESFGVTLELTRAVIYRQRSAAPEGEVHVSGAEQSAQRPVEVTLPPFQAVCSCGWESDWHHGEDLARDAAAAHERAHRVVIYERVERSTE